MASSKTYRDRGVDICPRSLDQERLPHSLSRLRVDSTAFQKQPLRVPSRGNDACCGIEIHLSHLVGARDN